MTPAVRRYFLDQLVSGIATIGPDFQAFSQRLVDRIVPVQMQHPGMNILGHPVGHAVDSVSNDGSTAVEYSTEEDYFSKSLEKLRRDWKHVRTSHPAVKKILFFSNRKCGPKTFTRLKNLQGHAKKTINIEFEVYDANRIAEYLVDHVLLNDSLVEDLAPFLGPLSKIRTEYIATHLVPEPAPDYIPRPTLEGSLQKRLVSERVVALAGLSGLGKSQTAAVVAKAMSSQFDIVVWLYASPLRSVSELAAFEIDRRGRRINASSLVRDRSCLLVLDDLQAEITLDALKSVCGSNSCILITRQISYNGDEKIEPLGYDEARALLETGLPSPCPDAIFGKVWRTIGGHPLALRLMNAGVRHGSWSDLDEDCQVIGQYPDEDRTQRLADRLLGRRRTSLETELTFFKWCGTSRVDRAFARTVLAPIGLRKIEEACLLTPDRADILRLHDIVNTSLKTLDLPIERYANEFSLKLETYIENVAFHAEIKDLRFVNLCKVHRSKLEELARGPLTRDAYIYCLLQAWDVSEIDLELIGSAEDRALAISGATKKVLDVSVYTAIEIVEATYRKTKNTEGKDRGLSKLETFLDVFKLLEQSSHISKEAQSGVLHHHAKALRLLNRKSEAIALCEQVIRGGHSFWAAKLLLARLYASDPNTAIQAKDLFFEIMESARSAPGSVEITVLLAVIEEMGRSSMAEWQKTFIGQYGQVMSDHIVAASACGFDQSFSALASIGRSWQWEDSQRFSDLLSLMPPWSTSDARNDYQRTAWGDILLSSSKVVALDRRDAVLHEAVEFYNSLEKPDSFNLQQKGQAFYLLKEYDEAYVAIMESIKIKPTNWNRYWLSKVIYEKGQYNEALQIMNEICSSCKDTDRFLSTFLEHRFEIRSKLSDPQAIDDLARAHSVCNSPKYKAALDKRLKAARNP